MPDWFLCIFFLCLYLVYAWIKKAPQFWEALFALLGLAHSGLDPPNRKTLANNGKDDNDDKKEGESGVHVWLDYSLVISLFMSAIRNTIP